MPSHFDILVIGAGSAGSVVASRLSEDPSCNVGLLEAGGMPDDPDIADPLKWTMLQGRPYDWAYRTVPQSFTAGRVHEWPRGRIVGGSSCLHAMAYIRGHPLDFEPWEATGGKQWSYAALCEGFARSERATSPQNLNPATTGPLDVYLPDDEVSPVVRAYMAAGQSLGVVARQGHNGGELIGTAPNSLNIRAGRRLSVADAYLTPQVLARKNLTLLTGHETERLVFHNRRATAATTVTGGNRRDIGADRIVLCAGTVATPLILMRSGIGDPGVLQAAGLACLIDRREVGRNLQDHLLALGNVYRARKPVPPSRLQHSESLMYLDSGDLSRSHGQPDIVLGCVVAPSAADGLVVPTDGEAYTILCGVTHPTSRGQIQPSGPGLDDAPRIDPHYLETEHDRAVFRRALKIARRVGAAAPLDEWRADEMLPGSDVQSDTQLDAFIALAASTHHHPAGTCRMGIDREAIVDPDLGLNGIDNVSIVDASIIPALPSGPINAAIVAIAEVWAARQGTTGNRCS